jgi:hypothetical protein
MKVGLKCTKDFNSIFFSLSFDKKWNPQQLHTDWYVPETSSLQVPSIPCWVGLGLCVEHMQLTSMQTICEDFLRCTQIEAPILQFFFTQDFLKCLVGWLVAQVDVTVKYVILWNQ